MDEWPLLCTRAAGGALPLPAPRHCVSPSLTCTACARALLPIRSQVEQGGGGGERQDRDTHARACVVAPRVYDVLTHGRVRPFCACVRACACAGLRGVTADVCILEEAAFIDPRLFKTVIVPLLGVSGTALLAISTPEADDDNYYSELMDMRDPDNPEKPLFHIIPIGLACQDCVTAGAASACTHKSSFVPPWKSAARQRKVAQILAGDKDLHAQENMGMRVSGTQYMFPAQDIIRLAQRPRVTYTEPVRVVYCAIDPSGGGSQSDYALATVTRIKGNYTVLGLDRTPSADSRKVEQLVVDHLSRLRRYEPCRGALIVLYVEANMSWIEVDRVRLLAERAVLQPCFIASHNSKPGKLGVITDESNKAAYVDTLRHLLADDRLSHARHTQSEDPEACIYALHDQLRRFRRHYVAPREPETQRGRAYMTGKGANRKDDLLLALMMAVYYSLHTRHDPHFKQLYTRLHGPME